MSASVTTLLSSVNPSTFGQLVSFTATVTVGGVPIDGGTFSSVVTFKDGVTTLGTRVVNGSGVATFNTSSLTAGTHNITAEYQGYDDTGDGGSTVYDPSTSNTVAQVVDKPGTNLNLAPDAAYYVWDVPPTAHGSITFTATVSPLTGGGTPSGTVDFSIDGVFYFTGTLSSGQATFTWDSAESYFAILEVGTHTVQADYAGDSNFGPSTATLDFPIITNSFVELIATPITLGPIYPGTDIESWGIYNPSVFGQQVRILVWARHLVGGPVVDATGTVEFREGATVLGTVTLNAPTGTMPYAWAEFDISTLSVGDHLIHAYYSGNYPATGLLHASDREGYTVGDDSHGYQVGGFPQTVTGADTNPDCPPTEIVPCPTPIEFPNAGEPDRLALPTLGGDDLPVFATAPEVCDPCDAAGPALALVLTPNGRVLAVDDSLQMTTTVKQGQNNFQPANGLEYCSSDSDIVTVTAHGGLVTAIGVGTATISVTWHGLYARAEITVAA